MATYRFSKTLDSSVITSTLVTFEESRISGVGVPRRLVLLHGAGLARDLTWRLVVNYLTEWDEVLIPDLPGMGDSLWVDAESAGFDEYLAAVAEFLRCQGWNQFDLVGYSFGGLLAMHLAELRGVQFEVQRLGLIEPAALLASNPELLMHRAEEYGDQAELLMSGKADAVLGFLDTVSPFRDKTGDDLVVRRLSENLAGLGYGVRAVSQALSQYSGHYANWTSPVPGMSLIGGLSPESMRVRHKRLMAESPTWVLHEVPRADHGVVYSRPKQVASAINALRA
ncbi:Pimeloyl-ACP methyl ester carboxylesterase [Thalassolituus maritimus]|uniref:Pimeloyl-ACP methyl ester carboxylesterase n=1 Tax=Thalassolituus maritimus TaxID=484498 RepID=A0A1N7L829_9GAMM|nr:alpha/beta hydrolase [Thalassolituus maritimus]SIS69976.1 Pimeloyl-ACP methyl ester carboxylesterase [Thalassolituus maritimus]